MMWHSFQRFCPRRANANAVLMYYLLCAERGDADERLHGLVNPRHPQGHQPPDAQGEDPHGGALHEGGAGQKAVSTGQPQPRQLALSQHQPVTAALPSG